MVDGQRTADVAEVVLPFSWQGVSLHAAGASAVRARIAPSGPSAVSIELADGLGLPVLSVASMVARPVIAAAVAGGGVGLGPGPAVRGGVVAGVGTRVAGAETPSYEVFESACGRRGSGDGQLRAHAPGAGCACSPGWPSMTRECWWWRPGARWRCRARTSPTWRARRCGGWCVRRRPSIPAGSCWWIPMRRLTIRR